jgi:hypothetical protein
MIITITKLPFRQYPKYKVEMFEHEREITVILTHEEFQQLKREVITKEGG